MPPIYFLSPNSPFHCKLFRNQWLLISHLIVAPPPCLVFLALPGSVSLKPRPTSPQLWFPFSRVGLLTTHECETASRLYLA